MHQAVKRFLSTTCVNYKKVQATNLKGKKTSSQQWLQRQLADPYVEKARMLNYRSAFKLIEIDDRFKLFTSGGPGQVIVDCGAAPGSWSQVAAARAASSTIIAIDRLQFYPIDGVHILGNQDFTQSHDKLKEILAGRQVNVVLSDMAPNATGVKALDSENIINLGYSVLRFAVEVSAIDAALLIKLWQCADCKKLETDIARFYSSVKVVKPNASRSDSAEIFLLGRQFKGLSVSPNANTDQL